MKTALVIANYDPAWPSLFAREADALGRAVPAFRALEHVGSTAVPGLAAAPTIDLVAAVDDPQSLDPDPVEGMGYAEARRVEEREPGRRFFWRGTPAFHLYHLHVVQHGGSLWARHLAFRDRLRADRALAERYAHHKRQLARQFGRDVEAYAEAKTSFIDAALTAP